MKPIVFSAPMVQAILEGRKTQTRRVMRTSDGLNKPIYGDFEFKGIKEMADLDGCGTWKRGPFAVLWHKTAHDDLVVKCQYEIGDLLWVRETWTENCEMPENAFSGKKIHYCADCKPDTTGLFAPCKWKKKPSTSMPRAAARIFLRVLNVSAERLQDIAAWGMKYEGIQLEHNQECYSLAGATFEMGPKWIALWNGINGKRNGGAFAWDKNPWVWVYTFERTVAA